MLLLQSQKIYPHYVGKLAALHVNINGRGLATDAWQHQQQQFLTP
jgi:hypothetical protein